MLEAYAPYFRTLRRALDEREAPLCQVVITRIIVIYYPWNAPAPRPFGNPPEVRWPTEAAFRARLEQAFEPWGLPPRTQLDELFEAWRAESQYTFHFMTGTSWDRLFFDGKEKTLTAPTGPIRCLVGEPDIGDLFVERFGAVQISLNF
jgi:hypothetical protein